MAAKTTYNVDADTSKMVPLITLVAADHVGFIGGPADAVKLDGQVGIDGKGIHEVGLSFNLRIGYLRHLLVLINNGQCLLFYGQLTSNRVYNRLLTFWGNRSQCSLRRSLRLGFLLSTDSLTRCYR